MSITVRLRVAGIYYNQVLSIDATRPTVADVLEEAKGQGGFDYHVVNNSIRTLMHSFDGKHISYDDTFSPGNGLQPDEPAVLSDVSLGGKARAAGLYALSSSELSATPAIRAVWQHYVVEQNGSGTRRSRTRPGGGFTDFRYEEVRDQDEITFRLVVIQFTPFFPAEENTI